MPEINFKEILNQIISDNPDIIFKSSKECSWDPQSRTIYYKSSLTLDNLVSTLHELGHANLNHKNFNSGINLIKMESLAWAEAVEIGRRYSVSISDDHIQRCLNTYRYWLGKRGECPKCGTPSTELNANTFTCYSCGNSWSTSADQLCRVYRKKTSIESD